MKTLNLITVLTFLTLGSFGQKHPLPADKKATKETVILFQSLYELKNKGIMYGHQDDLMYGYSWWYEKDRSDTKDAVGDYPAVAGFELGHIELGNDRTLDSVRFDQIKEQIKVHYQRGGVVTVSWHLNNPLTMQIKDNLPPVRMVLPGMSVQKKLCHQFFPVAKIMICLTHGWNGLPHSF